MAGLEARGNKRKLEKYRKLENMKRKFEEAIAAEEGRVQQGGGREVGTKKKTARDGSPSKFPQGG